MLSDGQLNDHGEVPTRLNPTQATLSELYLKSGNQCAFPNCFETMFDGQLIGQVCHIEDAMPGGRWNAARTNEENRREGNLMLMCYKHHVKTNDVNAFRTSELLRMKRDHETAIAGFEGPNPGELDTAEAVSALVQAVRALEQSARPAAAAAVPGSRLVVSHSLFAMKTGHTGIGVGLQIKNESLVAGTKPRIQLKVWSAAQGKLQLKHGDHFGFQLQTSGVRFPQPKPAEYLNLVAESKRSIHDQILYPKGNLHLHCETEIEQSGEALWQRPRFVAVSAYFVFAETTETLAHTVMDLYPNGKGKSRSSHKVLGRFTGGEESEVRALYASLDH